MLTVTCTRVCNKHSMPYRKWTRRLTDSHSQLNNREEFAEVGDFVESNADGTVGSEAAGTPAEFNVGDDGFEHRDEV